MNKKFNIPSNILCGSYNSLNPWSAEMTSVGMATAFSK